ncbi:pyrroloquinoline quinone biosynthesis protein PqqF [Pseudomonas sp. sp1636]|uniref:pyrroloquinoline quinone biosynthesis protein PqqF n=1 Tax=Pseudomonas sp. sp1636 TaxID=3036707 RepID=UPI0025A5529F|nr:pyrroloquinoline quinone biosynthesis protein PqqF [Pseudomonas sp. sp1636]MDM8350556.1 pyrroloquinoline quinone biosynthesis protein PqqF [Pseudomonas sp. sp1636]
MSAVCNTPFAGIVQPESRQLANGLQLATLSLPGTAKAAISVRVAAGSHDEPDAYPGMAHFLEHLLFLGSSGYAVEQSLMAFVQACGGQVNASTQARHTDYFCEVPANRLAEALARLLDMLANPLLDEAAQLREREVVHAEFLARGQDCATLVAVALGQTLPAGHRFAAFQAGNRDTLAVEQAAFQQALRAFHRRFYQAGQLSLLLLGPQSPDELYELARDYGAALPGQARQRQSPPAPLLPLRAQQLRMTLPGGAPALQLGFALEWAPLGLDEALDFLQTWLGSEASGGLLAGLREAGLCQGLQVRVVYRHAEQAMLLLSFAGVDEASAAHATVVAAVLDWLGFLAGAAGGEALCERYQAIKGCRLHSLPPLALALHWQDCLAAGWNPCAGVSGAGRTAVAALLRQMQDARRLIRLFGSTLPMPAWPAAGFALQMRREQPQTAVPRRWQWQLPPANPFLAAVPCTVPALAIAARVRWLPAPAAAGQGVLYWRCRLAEQLEPVGLLALLRAALRMIEANAAEVGVALQLSAQDDGWQLSLQGPAGLLPQVLQSALVALLNPAPAAWQQGLREARQAAIQVQAEMPFRQLLRRLPELFMPPRGECAVLTPQRLHECYRQACFEGLGVGIAASGQAGIERLFRSVAALHTPEPPAVGAAGRYWQDAAIDCSDTALLLFCPLPATDAATEAAWRLLAQLCQGAFFQRLRSELQLGYAVLCGFRQVQAQRGILFVVQSPQASADEILGHIEAFLRVQGERLAALDDRILAQSAVELRRQALARTSSPQELAEQHWQAHLAGLPESHERAVVEALAALKRAQLLGAHRQLRQAQGSWRVLANAAKPAAGWSALG